MSAGKMQFGSFEFETSCNICRKQRNQGNHGKCSKEKQRRRLEQESKP